MEFCDWAHASQTKRSENENCEKQKHGFYKHTDTPCNGIITVRLYCGVAVAALHLLPYRHIAYICTDIYLWPNRVHTLAISVIFL